MNALALKDMENFESNGYLQNCNFSATLQLFMPRNHASLNVIKNCLEFAKVIASSAESFARIRTGNHDPIMPSSSAWSTCEAKYELGLLN